jgi:hypothetical protein
MCRSLYEVSKKVKLSPKKQGFFFQVLSFVFTEGWC